MLKKSPLDLKKNLAKITLALLVLSIITSTVAMVPVVKAQGFPNVPTFPPVTATPTPSPTPTRSPPASPSPSPSPTEFPWNFTSIIPTKSTTVAGGFWSPLTIGIVAAAALVAFIVPAAFFYARRGKGKMLIEEEHPIDTQKFPAASNSSTPPSRYSQSSYQSSYQSKMPAKPTEPTRYGQTPSYGYRPQASPSVNTSSSTPSSSYCRPAPYTKICPHCKRSVRNDQNICPYCDKRLK